MSSLWTSPAGPLLVLFVGALLLILVGRRLPDQVRNAAPNWLAAVALLFWLLLRLQPAQEARYWTWHTLLGLNSAVGFQLDGWAWLAGMGIGMIALVAVALPDWQQRAGFADPRLWALITTSAALLVVLSDTWVSLLAAWLLLMLGMGLVAGAREAGSLLAWSLGILSTFFLLTASLFNGESTLDLPLGAVPLNVQAQLLLILAAVIPIGAYPFHYWLTPQISRSPGRYLSVHLLPGLAALHLLGRFELPLLASQAWVLLSAVALLGSALASWADQNPKRSWAYVLINRSSWVVLVIGLARLPAPAGAVLPLITLAFGGALWTITRVARPYRTWRMYLIASAAVLYGLPFTPGFAANLNLGQLTGSAVAFPIWLTVLLAQTLFFAAMLISRQSEIEETAEPTLKTPRALTLTLVALVLFVLWWGLFPATVARITGIATTGFYANTLVLLRSAGLSGWLTWLLPLALGLLVVAQDDRLFGALREWQDTIARIAELDWLYLGIERLLHSLSAAIGILGDLVDGAGQFGWVLLAALLAWILLGG